MGVGRLLRRAELELALARECLIKRSCRAFLNNGSTAAGSDRSVSGGITKQPDRIPGKLILSVAIVRCHAESSASLRMT